MPTPAPNGAASISQRTGRFRQPLSIDPRTTERTAASAPSSRFGVNPRSFMKTRAAAIANTSMAARRMYGTARLVA